VVASTGEQVTIGCWRWRCSSSAQGESYTGWQVRFLTIRIHQGANRRDRREKILADLKAAASWSSRFQGIDAHGNITSRPRRLGYLGVALATR